MAYTDLISLEDAKNFLRVDDTLTEDDNYITRIINSSFTWIEKRTNTHVIAKDKNYDAINGFTRVYDYPINTDLSTLTDYTFEKKGLYYNVCGSTSDTSEFTLNIGEVDPANVTPELIDVAYEIINFYYYLAKKEENKGVTLMDALSPMSLEYISTNKRFLV